jgi:hypothetical protein
VNTSLRGGNLVSTFKLRMGLSVEFEAGSSDAAGRIADVIENAALTGLMGTVASVKQSAVSDSILLDETGRMLLRPRSVCAEPLAGGGACGKPATEIVGSDGLGYYPACVQHAEAWSDRSHYTST